MIKPRNPPGKRSKAQAMVEFALALPVLLLVVYGLLEAGRLLFIYASVVTSARQAARYGSATGLTPANLRYYQDCGGIKAAAKRVAFINRIDDNNISITYDHGLNSSGEPKWWPQYSYNKDNPPACWPSNWANPNPIANGDRIRVQVISHWDPIVRVVPSWKGFDITSQSSRTLLVGASIAIEATSAGYTGSGQLALAKSASSETYQQAGEVITYTYTLINPGSNSIAGPFTITDDHIPGTFTCTSGPIAGGNGQASCTHPYVITAADVTAGHVTNNATANTNNGGSPLMAAASKTITLKPLPALHLVKAGVPPDNVVNNATILYTYTLTNTGNVPLSPPFTVNDDKVRSQNINCSGVPTPLLPQATATCTGTYTITNQDINNGQVVNVATATAQYQTQTITSNTATATVITPPLYLTLTARPLTITAPGTVITFTFTLRNPGNTNLTSPYTINDIMNTNKADCSNLTSPLSSGASTSCTSTYTVTQADIDKGSIINSATATARQNNKTVNSNMATVMISALQTVNLTLTKTASLSLATETGMRIDYTYTFQNAGNVTISGPYSIQDDKIKSVNCSGATGNLLPNASKTCTASYTTTQADLDEGSIVNTATAKAKFFAQDVTSTPAQATVITFTGPRLRLQKTASPTTMSNVPGQIITYTYTLKNTGGVPLSGPYKVTDDKIKNVSCPGSGTLNPAQSLTCTATYTTTPEDVSQGGVTNNASATAMNAGVPLASNSVTAFVPVYVCSGDTLTFGPVSNVDNVTWTLNNNSGIQLRISSISITWSNNGASSLTQVLLGGASIWTGSDSSGNFTLPGQSWTLDPSGASMQVIFSAAATDIRGTVTLSNPSCP